MKKQRERQHKQEKQEVRIEENQKNRRKVEGCLSAFMQELFGKEGGD